MSIVLPEYCQQKRVYYRPANIAAAPFRSSSRQTPLPLLHDHQMQHAFPISCRFFLNVLLYSKWVSLLHFRLSHCVQSMVMVSAAIPFKYPDHGIQAQTLKVRLVAEFRHVHRYDWLLNFHHSKMSIESLTIYKAKQSNITVKRRVLTQSQAGSKIMMVHVHSGDDHNFEDDLLL